MQYGMIRSSSIILILSVITLLLGLLVQVGLAAVLGTGREMDAYLVAISLPTFLAVISMTACVTALVPLFRKQLCASDPLLLARTSLKLFAIFFLIAFAVSAVVFLFADPIVRMIAPGLEAPTSRLASGLLQIMILGSFFDILRGYITAYFYSKERFLPPQFVPILNHGILLFGLVFLFPSTGLYGLAWAWAGGSLAMCIPLLVLFLRQAGFAISRNWILSDTGSVWGVMFPALIVVILQQATPLLDRLAASLLAPGAISHLGYGSKIPEILLRTLPMAVGLASLPLLSRQALEKDFSALRELAMLGIRSILLFAVPLALFVYAMRLPIIVLLFERGNFDSAASQSVADILGWYAFAFIPGSILYLLINLGFALRRPWVIARLTFCGICLTLILNLTLSRLLGPAGIAVSYLITITFLAAAFLLWLVKEMRMPPLLPDAAWLVKILLASILCLVFWLGIGYIFPGARSGFYGNITRLLLVGMVGAGIYVLTLYAVGQQEIRTIIQSVRNKIAGA
jgi:putative peptidoglycan lipid II flippase